MKKIFILVSLTVFSLSSFAQFGQRHRNSGNTTTTTQSSYSTSIYSSDKNSFSSGSNNSNDTSSEEFESIGVGYYGFKGMTDWAIDMMMIHENGLGFEGNIRSNVKEWKNISEKESVMHLNWDIGVNYSFLLTGDEDTKLYLTLAAGPSLRFQDTPVYDSRTGHLTNETKFYVDAFLNPRLSLRLNSIMLTAGYFYWAPKFKFSKDDGAVGGFFGAISYCF